MVKNGILLLVAAGVAAACGGKESAPPPTSTQRPAGVNVTNTCGPNPLITFVSDLTRSLNETLEIKENIRANFEECADANVDANIAGASIAKAQLRGCLTRKIELDSSAKKSVFGLIDQAYSQALETSPKSLAAWDTCGANVITCGARTCPPPVVASD